jgi:hypothetical protein
MDDDDITVVTSNVSNGSRTSLESAFSSFAPRQQSKWAYATGHHPNLYHGRHTGPQ